MALRVLHAPCLAAGNAGRLAQAERQLGLSSWCITTDPNPYGYPVDEQLPGPRESRLRFEWLRLKLLARAIRDFDVVHFNFGRTLFPNAFQLDLPLLRRFGKAIFMTYQGDDARQGDFCRAHFDITFATRVPPSYYTEESDARKRKSIAFVDRFVDKIYALNPDLMHVLPAKASFLPYTGDELEEWTPRHPDNERPVLVHAPTHRAVKGTELILDAVSRLKAEGENFELVLVENMRHADARLVYQRADLAIDQLFAGWYGGFAVEMMSLGKPVLCYLRREDLRFLPREMADELPIISVYPQTVYQTLKTWLRTPREQLCAIGQRGRVFVEKWHHPLRIARRLKADYEAALVRRAG